MAKLLPARWECEGCGQVYTSEEDADICAAYDRKVATGKSNVGQWDVQCNIIDETFSLPGNLTATELLADYICDCLEEDDHDTGPSNHSVEIAANVANGTVSLNTVLEAVASLRG